MGKFVKTKKVQAFLRKWSSVAKSKTLTVAVPAGAAGTVKSFYIPWAPIADTNGADIGGFGDSSVVLATGVFDNEVSPFTKDADLANGDYWVDYLTGECRGKKKTTGTSEAITWKYFTPIDPDTGSSYTVGSGNKTVAAAGTPEALAGALVVKKVTIQANFTNSNFVYVGATGLTVAQGIALVAGASMDFENVDLANIFIRVAVDGEGVRFNHTY